MVKVKREYVLGAAVCTVLAVALSITSFATENWVQADIKPVNAEVSTQKSHVKYGLFNGVYTQRLDSASGESFIITMTCVFGENSCAMLCRDTADQRVSELEDLINGKPVLDWQCNFVVPKSHGISVIRADPNRFRAASSERVFLDAACYLATIIFLSVSIVLGIGSAALLIWNVAGNPVQTLFSIYSIYYYVGAAAVSILVAIIVWGALFAASIVENIGILVTLNGTMKYEGNPILDYSYWLNLGSLFLYLTSFGLLMTRKYLMDNENLIMHNINQGNQVIF